MYVSVKNSAAMFVSQLKHKYDFQLPKHSKMRIPDRSYYLKTYPVGKSANSQLVLGQIRQNQIPKKSEIIKRVLFSFVSRTLMNQPVRKACVPNILPR